MKLLLLTLWLGAESASLRGIHAVDANTIWASGSKSTVLLSTDAGKTWATRDISEPLDFRSIYAFSATKAYALSSGDAEKSKLFRTDDGGQHWTLLYTSKEGFLDGLKFWDEQHGIIVGDSIGGNFVVLTTADAGQTWQRRTLPPAQPDEGAFAASNSSLAVHGKQEAWIGTTASRILHTADGGATWTEPAQSPHGFRSAVACQRETCIATGPGGTDQSNDGGQTWTTLDKPGYHALTLAGPAIYASGSDGRIAVLLK